MASCRLDKQRLSCLPVGSLLSLQLCCSRLIVAELDRRRAHFALLSLGTRARESQEGTQAFSLEFVCLYTEQLPCRRSSSETSLSARRYACAYLLWLILLKRKSRGKGGLGRTRAALLWPRHNTQPRPGRLCGECACQRFSLTSALLRNWQIV